MIFIKNIILCDLDDVISVFMPTVIKKYNEIYNTTHTIEEINSWEIPESFNPRIWSVFEKSDVLEYMPLKENAYEIIKKWYHKGYEVVIVTGVEDVKSYEDKLKWLKNVKLDKYIKDIIPTKNKYLINGTILIDDNPEYLKEWKKFNPEGIPILMTAQHNKNKVLPFIRVNNWNELSNIVNIILNNI